MLLNPHTIPATICTIFALTCGFFVLFKDPRAKLKQIFFFICFNIAAWMSFYVPFNFQVSEFLLIKWFKISYCFISFLPIMCFTFVTSYLNVSKNRFWYRINSLIGLTFCIISLTTDWVISGVNYLPYFPYPKAGPLHVLLMMHCFYLVFIMLKMLIDALKREDLSAKSKNHLKYMAFGLTTLALGAFDYSANYNYQIYPIGPFTNSIFLITVTTAIFKHQLMDIQIAIKKGLVYSFLISFITLIYLAVVLISEYLFHTYIGYRAFTLSIVTTGLIAIIFIPLRNKLQELVDKFLFKNTTLEIIEENELLRREISQTERLKSIAILASGMAHEIKNPLTALKTFSEYLPHKIDDKEFLRKFSPLISKEINRIDSLVHELLDFAKPAPVQLKPTNLHALIESTLDFLSNDFVKHKININKDYQLDPELSLNLDANQFKQALLNIILNSIDAMHNGGTLTFATLKSFDSSRINLKIQDNGVGINSEDLPHIFDPFFTKKDHGTGLGLSITHEIIKNHNGRIFVESKAGKGTTFIIELPL